MGLTTYRKKRDFAKTSEPRGKRVTAAPRKSLSFVVQKHAARRLHYDFRLEIDGVLKSWAVTKGPSLVLGEKRLAVHVEDHPLEYGTFEGTIPKGAYGGGTVILWDRGVWTPLHDTQKSLRKGHLEFTLEGEKLRGRWHLVRMSKKASDKRENWLLIKGDDEEARSPTDPDILVESPASVESGRLIAEVENETPGWSSKTGRMKPAPSASRASTATVRAKTPAPRETGKAALLKSEMLPFVQPSLASLVATPASSDRYIHEIKFDGYRIQPHIREGKVRLLTRSGLDWSRKFGQHIAEALSPLANTAILDGEIVVEGAGGASDFSALQEALTNRKHGELVLYMFDILYLDGTDLRPLPQIERKNILKGLLTDVTGPIRYSEHFNESGDIFLAHACRLSLEGMISKLKTAPYVSGRSRNWLKAKCSSRQEFVIGGFTPSTVDKQSIGSLALGYFDNGKLRYAGRVGTGFPVATAKALYKDLSKRKVVTKSFADRLTAEQTRQLVFITPDRVAEIEFRGWTADHLLRHASFRGIREDKLAEEIVREDVAAENKEAAPKCKPAPAPSRTVPLTHPDRLYWPAEGVTKEGLADYYIEVWRWAAPYIAGRPLALLRCPNGVDGEHFFQKNAWEGRSKSIKIVADPAERGSELIAIEDLDGLLGLVQSAALEIHPWGASLSDWDHPDMITMDLDPGDDVDWARVIKAAREVKERLEARGLAAFVKTSGGKGLHVVAPLKPDADWPAVKTFTKQMADEMAADSPQDYVSTIAKAKRKGKILIDYLRNQRGATAVAAYSTRARPRAAVSMPLAWDELKNTPAADYFTIMNAPARLKALPRDPWVDFRKASRALPDEGKSARSLSGQAKPVRKRALKPRA